MFIGERLDTVRRVAADSRLPFVLLADEDGAVAARYGVRQHPLTFLIDRQGRLIGRVIGERDWASAPARDWVAHPLGRR